MLNFHEPHRGPLLETARFLEMQCEVSAQPSLGVGGALDMLRKVQWPWHRRSLAAALALALSLSALKASSYQNGKALDLVSLTLAPNSHVLLYTSIYHGSIPY